MRHAEIDNLEAQLAALREEVEQLRKERDWFKDANKGLLDSRKALRPTWTSERPKEPGWYWRKAPKGEPWVVEVTVSDIAKNFPPSDFANDGHWSGPIPPPEE